MDTITTSYEQQEPSEPKSFFRIPESTKGKVFLAIGAIVILGIILILAVFFSDYLGTRAIGFNGSRVFVKQGETISLKSVTKQGVIARNVEICRKSALKTACKSLAFSVGPDTPMINTVIPVNYPLGKADLRLVGIYGNGVKVLLGTKSLLVQKFIAENNGEGGSGGGGNDGGSGENTGSFDPGSTSTPTPTANLPYGPY